MHCLHVKVEVRMKKKSIYRANTSPCLPPLSMGMASPDVEESVVEKHSCVGAWNGMRYIPSLVLSSSRLQLLPFWKGAGISEQTLRVTLNLALTGLISLQSKGLSRVFSNTTVQKHQNALDNYKSVLWKLVIKIQTNIKDRMNYLYQWSSINHLYFGHPFSPTVSPPLLPFCLWGREF